MTREWPIAVLCSGAVLVGGCTNLVNITSRPTGARVWIDGVDRGRTPIETRVTWSPWRYNRITLEHPGYHPFSTVLRRTFRWPDPPAGLDKSNWDVTLGAGVIYGGLLPLAFMSEEEAPPGMIVLPVLTFGALRGPVDKQHFVLAPARAAPEPHASSGAAAASTAIADLPRPSLPAPETPSASFSVGLGVVAANWASESAPAFHLEACWKRYGLVISGGPLVRVWSLPSGEEWEAHEEFSLAFRHYPGEELRSVRWFWEAGMTSFRIDYSGSGAWEEEATHLTARIGMRLRWSGDRLPWFSEVRVSLSEGEEIRPPAADPDVVLDRYHQRIGVILVGATF